jgi:hypothetical protein
MSASFRNREDGGALARFISMDLAPAFPSGGTCQRASESGGSGHDVSARWLPLLGTRHHPSLGLPGSVRG